jgi:hypothetical protein
LIKSLAISFAIYFLHNYSAVSGICQKHFIELFLGVITVVGFLSPAITGKYIRRLEYLVAVLLGARDGVKKGAGDDAGPVIFPLLEPRLVFVKALEERDELRQREPPELLFPQPQRLPADGPEL